MADSPRPTVRRRRLGRELRRIRDEGGLTLESAARRLERTASSLSKIERGVQGLRHGELVFMLDTYSVTDPDLRQTLISLRRSANQKGWWHQYREAAPELMDFISLETDASSIRVFETMRIPGLLQTEDYARAMFRGAISPSRPADMDAKVNIRMTRQNVLTQADPPRFWVIISEAALHQNVGGPEIMRRQLQHLIEVAEMPNVMLQVLANAAVDTLALDGAFMIIELGQRQEFVVVFVECLTRGWYLEDDEDLERFQFAFDRLRAAALSPTDSLTLIESVLSNL